MINEHKHIGFYEVLHSIAGDKLEEIVSSAEECHNCRQNINEAEAVLKSVKKFSLGHAENICQEMEDEVKTEDAFLELFDDVLDKKSIEPQQRDAVKHKENILFNLLKTLIKPKVLLPAAFACISAIVISYNFFYYMFIPENEFIRISKPVDSERKGTWFSGISLSTESILANNDIIRNSNDNLVISVDQSFKFESLEGSKFSVLENFERNMLEIFDGEFYFKFNGSDLSDNLDKSSKQKMISILLPLFTRLEITGTEIYCNSSDSEYKIWLIKGKSKLITGTKKSISLSPGILYTYSIDDTITKKKISKKKRKKILKKFTLGKEYLKKKKFKKKKFKSLNEIRKYYDRIDKIRLFNGQIIKGAIIKKGKTIKVITVDGIITIKKKDIQKTSIVP
jgi:hypothetical protein